MSYVRFSETSNVYVFLHVEGFYGCCACWLQEDGGYYKTQDAARMVGHLWQHVIAGHLVPRYAIEGLAEEAGFYAEHPERSPFDWDVDPNAQPAGTIIGGYRL